MLKSRLLILAGCLLILLAACGDPEPACPTPPGGPQYLSLLPDELPVAAPLPSPTPFIKEIKGRQVEFDAYVEGPLCNASWTGMVYVSCNVQVYPWQENPTFLENCDFTVAPDAVVYVAWHNDTAYYKGCSCHTGEIVEP